jgi:hypothetical protein
VESTVRATAQARAVSGDPLPCKSLGRLERRVVELLEQRLAKPSG